MAELIRWDGPLGIDVCAGASGLAREISRVVRFSPERVDVPLQSGDAVLVAYKDWKRALGALEATGNLQVAAIIVSPPAHDHTPRISEPWSTPLLLLSEPRLDQAQPFLNEWLEQCCLHEERQAVEIRQHFGSLDGSADVRLMTERLVQLTGKPVFVHDAFGNVELACQPAARRLSPADFEATVRAAGATLGRRAGRGRFPVIGLAYDELPALDSALISLATGGGSLPTQYLSILGRASEFTHRDRAALAAASQAGPEAAITTEPDERWDTHLLDLLLAGRLHQADVVAQRHGHNLNRPHVGLAFSIPCGASAAVLADLFTAMAQPEQAFIHSDEGRIVCLLPAEHGLADHHQRANRVRWWQAQIAGHFGAVSVGYTALHGGASGTRQALIEARHALADGERLRGPGHVSSYAELSVQDFLLHGQHELHLQALRDSVLGPILSSDPSLKNELAETLRAHLDTGCRTVQTAEFLGVHRNSVLYRLQRITELMHVDLEDPDTRLLLQLALRAADALTNGPGSTAHPAPHGNGADHTRVEVVWADDLALNGRP